MLCKIADFYIEFINPSEKFQKFLQNYKTTTPATIKISITDNDIQKVREIINYPASNLQLEATAFYDKLLEHLPLNNALFLHSSLISVDNVGIAFTALSGTGKSTHTLLWQQLLGDKMEIINGDKPIIRFIDNIAYGYGTPWNGKENLGTNKRVPLKHICFIEQSPTNICERLTAQDAINRIFSQIFVPSEPAAAFKTLELLNNLLTKCSIWNIKCTKDIEAAQVAYNAIFKENSYET